MKKYPSHTLFAVTQAEGAEKADWTPIGVAFPNKDGSLGIVLDDGKSIPAGQRLVLRQRKPKADTNTAGQQ